MHFLQLFREQRRTCLNTRRSPICRYLSIPFSSAGRECIRSTEAAFPLFGHGPPMIEIAPLQLLATFAAEASAIPPDIGQRIADGIHIWDRQLGDLISLAHIEKGASVAQDPTKLA